MSDDVNKIIAVLTIPLDNRCKNFVITCYLKLEA